MNFSRTTAAACYCSLAFVTSKSFVFVATRPLCRSPQRAASAVVTSSGRYPTARTSTRRFPAVVGVHRIMSTTEMDSEVATNYKTVENRVAKAAVASASVRLVAVSKTKPLAMLQAAYTAGCRCFGENYVQELVEKAELWQDRDDVHWHFIGALQSNKCNALVNCMRTDVSRLIVETVASPKLASKLNNAVSNIGSEKRLKVFVQVNTSGEDSKSGVEPGQECVDLCLHIVKDCPALELCGLMTIGAPGDAGCFDTLAKCREQASAALAGVVDLGPLELSMGMSGDFEEAIAAGATNVRVGSTIFGDRDYSTK